MNHADGGILTEQATGAHLQARYDYPCRDATACARRPERSMTKPTRPDPAGATTPRRFRSQTLHTGLIRATTRSFLYALGQDDDEVRRPHLCVAHTGGEMSPRPRLT